MQALAAAVSENDTWKALDLLLAEFGDAGRASPFIKRQLLAADGNARAFWAEVCLVAKLDIEGV